MGIFLESYPLSQMFHEVKPKEKEITKLGLCRLAKLCLEGLLSSHSKERVTFRNYLLMSLQVYQVGRQELFTYELASVPMALTNSNGSLSKTNKEFLQILMAHCRKPTRSLGNSDAWVFFLKVTHFLECSTR